MSQLLLLVQLFVLPRSRYHWVRYNMSDTSTLTLLSRIGSMELRESLKKKKHNRTQHKNFFFFALAFTHSGSKRLSQRKSCKEMCFTFLHLITDTQVVEKNNASTSSLQRCLLKPSPERASLVAPSDRPPDNSVLVRDPTLPSSGHYLSPTSPSILHHQFQPLH